MFFYLNPFTTILCSYFPKILMCLHISDYKVIYVQWRNMKQKPVGGDKEKHMPEISSLRSNLI